MELFADILLLVDVIETHVIFCMPKKEDCLGCEDKSACSKRHERECENELIGSDGNIIRGCDIQGCRKKHRSVNEQEKMVTIPESVLNELKSNNLRLEARLIEQKKELDLRYKELDLLYKKRFNEIFELQDDIRNLNIQLTAADSEKKKIATEL